MCAATQLVAVELRQGLTLTKFGEFCRKGTRFPVCAGGSILIGDHIRWPVLRLTGFTRPSGYPDFDAPIPNGNLSVTFSILFKFKSRYCFSHPAILAYYNILVSNGSVVPP